MSPQQRQPGGREAVIRAITVTPRVKDSLRLDDVAEPQVDERSLLAETLMVGVCGTDREIIADEHGEAPPGPDSLALGHEALDRSLSVG